MDQIARAKCLCGRAQSIVDRARSNVIQARALAISVRRTEQIIAATRYENRLIRELKR